jgi:DNA helicase-2/ATP-dependent DNA helicase PcrA
MVKRKDSGQEKAIAHRNGPMRVVACAGSGKTTTVARRIAEMVMNGIPRGQIAAITFNDRAADHLKKKIREEMDKVMPNDPQLGDMFVGTIHSFAFFILKDYDYRYRDFDVLDSSRRWAFLQNIGKRANMKETMKALGQVGERWWVYLLHDFFRDADLYRVELCPKLKKNADEEALQRYGAFIQCFDKYREKMFEHHFIDYAEMLFAAYKLITEKPDVLAKIRQRFRYFVVDEFQDTDKLQYETIKLLAGESRNLMVVGDDDQCIYKWRGTRPRLFIDFHNDFPDAEEAKLENNYRSTNIIVKAAESLINHNSERIPKSMKSDNPGDLGDVYRTSLHSREHEQDFIVDRIRYLSGKKWKTNDGTEFTLNWSDMTILFRRHVEMERFAVALGNNGIETNIQEHGYLFYRPCADLVRYAFAYMGGYKKPQKIREKPYEYGERIPVTETELHASLMRCANIKDEDKEKIFDWCQKRRIWLKECCDRKQGEQKKKSSVGWFLTRRIYPQNLLQDLYNLMGIKGNFSEALMADLAKISDCLKDFETVYQLLFPDQLRDLVDYIEEYVAIHEQGRSVTIGGIEAVNMMTVHQAKGLEFPVVFIPGTDKRRGWKLGAGYRDFRFLEATISYDEISTNIEDERRLFYVAVTRSEKFLYVTYPATVPWGQNHQNANPVDFFDEFAHEQIIDEPRSDPTTRMAGTGERRFGEELFPTTYSDISYYFKCPYDYYMRKLLGFCPPIVPLFGYGKQIHKMLKRIHEDFEEGSTTLIPALGQIDRLVAEEFYMRYLSGEKNIGEWQDKAKKVLNTYVLSESDDFLRIFKAEVPFEIIIGSALVSGTIDLLQKLDVTTRAVKEVDIVEFKTYKMPDTEWDPKILDVEMQVRLYAIAAKKGLLFDPHQGKIKYLREKNVKKKDVDLSEIKIAQTQSKFLNAIGDIKKREFPGAPGQGIDCKKCDWKKMCKYCDDEGRFIPHR